MARKLKFTNYLGEDLLVGDVITYPVYTDGDTVVKMAVVKDFEWNPKRVKATTFWREGGKVLKRDVTLTRFDRTLVLNPLDMDDTKLLHKAVLREALKF